MMALVVAVLGWFRRMLRTIPIIVCERATTPEVPAHGEHAQTYGKVQRTRFTSGFA